MKTALDEKQQAEQSDDTTKMIDESVKIQYFFQSNEDKIDRKYTSTRIRPRNFLSNIAYFGINREDFYNENFIFDVYLLITKNLNLFSLDRKLANKKKREMLYKLCKDCMPQKFYQHICKENSFLYLNVKNVLQSKVSEIINECLNKDTENYNEISKNLSQYKNIFQYIYSSIFPQIFCSTERQGFDLQSSFHIIFKT